MENIGLVLLVKNERIYEGRIITQQFKSKSMEELLNEEHSLDFERLFIVHKH